MEQKTLRDGKPLREALELLEGVVRRHDDANELMHQNLSAAVQALDLKHTAKHDALAFQLEVTGGTLQRLRTKVEAGPEPVANPIMCPNGHTGLVMAVGLAKFDAKDPSKSEVIGGGFSCPKCGSTFYADREGRWLPAEAAAPPGESPPAKASSQTHLRVRSRRGEEL